MPKKKFLYNAFGLNISSEFFLPELSSGRKPVDIKIISKPLSSREVFQKSPHFRDHSFNSKNPNRVFLHWKNEASLLVRDGKEIWVDPDRKGSPKVLRLVLLGAALSIILEQRGYLVLHGSAVASKKGAIAFLGASGEGKSTTVALFHARGYPLLTDNALALDPKKGFQVIPAFPQIKLWPDAARFLKVSLREAPLVEPGSKKRSILKRKSFFKKNAPLRKIYVLKESPKVQIRSLDPRQAFVELLRCSYGIERHSTKKLGASHFTQCARLSSKVPVVLLKRGKKLADLPALIQAVERDLL